MVNFVFENDEFAFKMMNFVLKTGHLAYTIVNNDELPTTDTPWDCYTTGAECH